LGPCEKGGLEAPCAGQFSEYTAINERYLGTWQTIALSEGAGYVNEAALARNWQQGQSRQTPRESAGAPGSVS